MQVRNRGVSYGLCGVLYLTKKGQPILEAVLFLCRDIATCPPALFYVNHILCNVEVIQNVWHIIGGKQQPSGHKCKY